jgi:phospholipase C
MLAQVSAHWFAQTRCLFAPILICVDENPPWLNIGVRVPFYIISPWTRGNRVFTERADHNSQILFIENWLTAKGYGGIVTDQMVSWRREHMSDLVNAFDFDNVSQFIELPWIVSD